MSLIACALIAIGVTIAFLFVLGACRLSGIADDTAEQVIRQLAEGHSPMPPQVFAPVHFAPLDQE